MVNTETIKWGIIGCGKVTEVKSGPAYQKTEGFELLAVMRRNEEKLKDYALRHNVTKFYTDAQALVNDSEINAVYIATPPDSHKYYALMVAKAGKICCIEKPMGSNYADSLEIYSAFKEKKIPLFIAYYRRSLPRFNTIKQWLNKGEIGEIRHVRWHLSKQPNPLDINKESNWRTDARIAPGGYFDDLASHGLDLFIYLMGNIVEAQGITANQMGLYSAKDAIVGNWIHENGATGQGSWNFGSHRREDKVEIFGSRGKISFSVFNEEPIVLINDKGEEKLEIPNPIHIQEFHVSNMRAHLAGEKTHPSLGKSGLHTSWVMDKILGVF